MVHHVAITKARINLGQLAKRAHLKGEYFILEKDGIPVAGLMSADELEDYLELQDPHARKVIAEGAKDVRAGRVRPAELLLAETAKRPYRTKKVNASKSRK